MSEIQFKYLLEFRRLSLGLARAALLLDNIQSNDAKIADVFADQSGNIIVSNQ